MFPKTAYSILHDAHETLLHEYHQRNLPIPSVKKFGINPGWNAVVGSHGCCGIAMSFLDNNPRYDRDQTEQDLDYLKSSIGLSLFDIAERNIGESVSRRSIAVASLNALSQPFVSDAYLTRKGYSIGVNGEELVRKDDIVVIVGYGGLVKRYAGRCKELHVTDQRPVESFRTTIIDYDIRYGPGDIEVHPADENKEIVPEADIVIITGSTLVNGTFEEVAGYAKNARIRALYGSSAQLIPDVLFQHGMNIVMSVAISDPLQFEYDILNAPDMETALRTHQRKYTVMSKADE